MKLLLTFILSLYILPLCAQRMTAEDYIAMYKDDAIAEMKRSGVPASITLAQGLLETESGNSALLKESNNHFGIKCKSNWTGASVKHTDDAKDECFRKYPSARESYADHSNFLKSSQRYASLFQLQPNDYKGWAHGLKNAGYATNPKYAAILIKNIETHSLFQYDEMPAEGKQQFAEATIIVEDETNRNTVNSTSLPNAAGNAKNNNFNGLKAIYATKNTSLLAIATKEKIPLAKLLAYNDLEQDGLLQDDQYIYLEKKEKMGKQASIVLPETATLHEVSQLSGVQLEAIATYNNLSADAIVNAGSTIKLRP